MNIAITPTTSALYKQHTDLLAASAISVAVAHTCGLRSTQAPATAHPIQEGADCIEIPYQTLDGTALPSVRYAAPKDLEGVKEEMQVTGLEVGGRTIHPFLPVVLPQLMKEKGFLIVTLGEIAALAGCSAWPAQRCCASP